MEDNWSGDESVFNKQMRMPNVYNNKRDYQREIGLNLDTEVKNELKEPPVTLTTKKTEERQDTVKEARDMMPIKPFYKITKKDRI
jgi:hypothetical protein